MASLSPAPVSQFFDANGNPLAGGKLYTYVSGTTTPLATFDAQNGTENTNPIILNLISAMNPVPSGEEQDAIRIALTDLIDAGYLQRMDRFGILAGLPDDYNRRIDWKDPTKFITMSGAAVTTQAGGFIGSGAVAAHGATGFIPNTHGVNFTLNSASIFIYAGLSAGVTSTSQGNYIGANSGTSADLWYSDASDNIGGFLNDASYTRADSYPTRPSDALLCFNRAGANDVKIYSDGVEISNFGETVAATTLPSVEFWLGCMNVSGAEFYGTNKTTLNQYPLDQVLGWYHECVEFAQPYSTNAIEDIHFEHKVDFNFVLIDGSPFSGEAELRCVRPFLAEKAIIALDDINDIKNLANYNKLKGFGKLLWEDWSVRNGAAIFEL